jgi:uncharacterized protein (TIGR02466 family)
MNDKSTFSIFPLFPSTVVGIAVNEDLSGLNLVQNYDYIPLNSDESAAAYKTQDNQVLKRFPKEQAIILDYFNRFKSDVLKLSNSFAISSSWATRIDSNGYSQYHDHRNSAYSAVLYLDDVSQGGEIQFQSPNPSTVFLLNPEEWNTFNYEVYHITPAKNLLLFFPSYLQHRINRYLGKDPRYSIAMNFVPVGQFGRGDSTVNYQLSE